MRSSRYFLNIVSTVLSLLFILGASAAAQQPKVLAPHDPVAPKVAKSVLLAPGAAGSLVGGPW